MDLIDALDNNKENKLGTDHRLFIFIFIFMNKSLFDDLILYDFIPIHSVFHLSLSHYRFNCNLVFISRCHQYACNIVKVPFLESNTGHKQNRKPHDGKIKS